MQRPGGKMKNLYYKNGSCKMFISGSYSKGKSLQHEGQYQTALLEQKKVYKTKGWRDQSNKRVKEQTIKDYRKVKGARWRAGSKEDQSEEVKINISMYIEGGGRKEK